MYHLRSAIRFDRHDDGRRAVLHPFHDNLAVVVVVGVQKEAGLLAVRGDRIWRELDCDFGTIGLAKRSKQKVACRVRGEDAAPDATWSSSWRRHGQPTHRNRWDGNLPRFASTAHVSHRCRMQRRAQWDRAARNPSRRRCPSPARQRTRQSHRSLLHGPLLPKMRLASPSDRFAHPSACSMRSRTGVSSPVVQPASLRSDSSRFDRQKVTKGVLHTCTGRRRRPCRLPLRLARALRAGR